MSWLSHLQTRTLAQLLKFSVFLAGKWADYKHAPPGVGRINIIPYANSCLK